jgi:orotate phosphoribosyltransferase
MGKLSNYINVKINDPNADFWIVRIHDEDKLGKPVNIFKPNHFGITVTSDKLLPKYLFYIFEYLYISGYFRKKTKGILRKQHINKEDILSIEIDDGNINENIVSHTNTSNLVKQNLYAKAKMGDLRFAKVLMNYVLKPEIINNIINQFPNATLVPVLKSGNTNQIPYAYTLYLKSKNKNYNILKIKQTNKIQKTNKSALYRLVTPNIFTGEIKPNENYIIIDDVITTGSTVKNLENYIKENGGNVVLITTIASANNINIGKGTNYDFDSNLYKVIDNKLGIKNIENLFKKYGFLINIKKLTYNQLKLLTLYNNLSTLEKRIKLFIKK